MTIADIQNSCRPVTDQLLGHHVYQVIHSPDSLRQFMSLHVYAVWDFMSLLKSLQNQLTCVANPWIPPEDRIAARMINEIVLGEESDIDMDGNPASHFELYLQAMLEIGADTRPVKELLLQIRSGLDWETAAQQAHVPVAAIEFMRSTFLTIQTENLAAIASAFTIGRENLIPGLFRGIVESLQNQGEIQADRFLYYLDRHISLDEEEHGPLAFGILERICGSDLQKWNAAKHTALSSLKARLTFWDAIDQQIRASAVSV
jgi:hypothetical protein